MIIRQEQNDELQREGDVRLRQRVTARMRDLWKEEYRRRGDAAFSALVNSAIDTARALDFTDEHLINRFVNLQISVADIYPNVAEADWAREILDDTTLYKAQKLDRLLEKADENT